MKTALCRLYAVRAPIGPCAIFDDRVRQAWRIAA